jgi:NhaC family Na+:H+ antiporter
MANGFVSNTGVEQIDTLFSRGGMSSMLYTIWLILGALSFAAVMEYAGFLERLVRPIIAHAHSTGALIASVIGTAIGLNILSGDQYVSIVMPSRIYRIEFAKRRIAPRMLSRTVEDAGTVTSPLIPWNSCGAYMAGVLGVATAAYLPYCFFNLLSPVISLLYGLTGFHIEYLPGGSPSAPGDVPATPATPEPPAQEGAPA